MGTGEADDGSSVDDEFRSASVLGRTTGARIASAREKAREVCSADETPGMNNKRYMVEESDDSVFVLIQRRIEPR